MSIFGLLYIKILKFKKLTIPEFRAIFGVLKYTKNSFEKIIPITDKQPLILKNTFWTKKNDFRISGYFGTPQKCLYRFLGSIP